MRKKTIYEVVATVFVCILMFQPSPTGEAQRVVPSKEVENKEIKARIDSKTEDVLSNLNEAIQKAKKEMPKGKVVYKTRIKFIHDTLYIIPIDSTNFLLTNEILHDTVFFEILKRSKVNKILFGNKSDTVFSSRTKPINY